MAMGPLVDRGRVKLDVRHGQGCSGELAMPTRLRGQSPPITPSGPSVHAPALPVDFCWCCALPVA